MPVQEFSKIVQFSQKMPNSHYFYTSNLYKICLHWHLHGFSWFRINYRQCGWRCQLWTCFLLIASSFNFLGFQYLIKFMTDHSYHSAHLHLWNDASTNPVIYLSTDLILKHPYFLSSHLCSCCIFWEMKGPELIKTAFVW